MFEKLFKDNSDIIAQNKLTKNEIDYAYVCVNSRRLLLTAGTLITTGILAAGSVACPILVVPFFASVGLMATNLARGTASILLHDSDNGHFDATVIKKASRYKEQAAIAHRLNERAKMVGKHFRFG